MTFKIYACCIRMTLQMLKKLISLPGPWESLCYVEKLHPRAQNLQGIYLRHWGQILSELVFEVLSKCDFTSFFGKLIC